MAHYVGMSGLHGYIPQFCASYDTMADAAESMAQLFDIGKAKTRELRLTGYVDLSLQYHGNEYAEIIECDCDDPGVHDDC